MRCFFISTIFLALSVAGWSQTYHFDNYGVKDGLSQSTVYRVVQDEDGNLWIGTRSGISRFDGNSFTNFTTSENVASNGARSVLKHSSGQIWFGHLLGGISLYADGKFSKVTLDSVDIGVDISSLVEDSKGRVWIGTVGEGIYRLDNPNKKPGEPWQFHHFRSKDGASEVILNMAIVQGDVFLVTDIGIIRFKTEEESFDRYAPEGLSTFFQFTSLFEDSQGNVWYGTYNGGLYRQNKAGEFKIYDIRNGLGSNWISHIAEDNLGRIWIGTFGGGVSLLENEKFITYDDKNGLPDLKIFDIISDREGNILIGSNENGLFIFKGEHFVSYTNKNGLLSDQVRSVIIDKRGRTWIGTNAGLSIMEVVDGQKTFTHLTEEGSNFFSNDIRFLRKDRQGYIWVGTWGDGVMRINPDNLRGPYEYPGRLNATIPFQMVTAMDIDKDNNLWVGTLDGLLYYEIDSRQMNRLSSAHGLAGNEISEIYSDREGVVWVGSKGKGLASIRDTTFTILDLGGEITPNVITEDSEGDLWIGTDGQGLLLSKDKKRITGRFTREDGLLANLINLLEVDRDNNIWIGTNKGLNKLRRGEDITFLAYTEQDGFTGIETQSRASYRDKEDVLYFGTVNGMIKYDPSKDRTGEYLPLVRISDLKVNLNPHPMKDEEEFTYKEKSFYFDFKGIYLTNPKSVRYKYILEGVDRDWSAPTKLTFANYPALPDGKYTFKVIASNNSGKWTEVPATYSFTINPPFWKTWWFYLFCVVFFGSWIVFLIKKREENLQREKKILEEKVEERTAEIQEKNKELANKNKDITDSIRYAERIQRAILPPDEEVKHLFPDSFVFYRPKDIVSGDFYWVSNSDQKSFFSAVDCTGHGVPGAFMSIVGHNLLDKIVKEEHIDVPSEILDSLNNSVSETLRQRSDHNEVKDGMDLGLIGVDFKKMKLEYAGAHNPMYLYRKGELTEIKADKFAIGSFIRGEKRKFTNHVLDIEKGDMVYVFSDGFPDQFGGDRGKKYKYKPFKEFLLSICNKDADEQRALLQDEFLRWLGSHEQIDDVIVFGVRI